jgi:hypothetical protein
MRGPGYAPGLPGNLPPQKTDPQVMMEEAKGGRKGYTPEQLIGKLRKAKAPLALVSLSKPHIPGRTSMLLWLLSILKMLN